jgi:hypothetical protein
MARLHWIPTAVGAWIKGLLLFVKGKFRISQKINRFLALILCIVKFFGQ